MRERLKSDLSEKVVEYLFDPTISAEKDRSFENMMDVNKAHLTMLECEGIVDTKTSNTIMEALDEILKKGKSNLKINPKLEDLYFIIEEELISKVGVEIGGQLHTGRSRNDLYATLTRMNCRESILKISGLVLEVRHVLLKIAKDHSHTIISGYTHMQPAEPITLGHYFSAILHGLERDFLRLCQALQGMNSSPLGAGAMAGTTFPINRETTAEMLGFSTVMGNSLDGIASRDYILESLSAMNILMNTINRFTHDLYIWSTDEYGIVEVGDSVAASSSIMPQKKNPITLEHIKAKSSHVLGAIVSATGCMSNISYGHSRDLAESTTYFWEAIKEVESTLELLIDTVQTLLFKEEKMLNRAESNFSTVTELANTVVREENISFREAHQIVGRLVSEMLERNVTVSDLDSTLIEEAAYHVIGKKITISDENIENALNPISNVSAKVVVGGPAPSEVINQFEKLSVKLDKDKSFHAQQKSAFERSKQGLAGTLVN